MGEVLLLKAVNTLISHFYCAVHTVGTITLGAKCNELILLSARYEIRAASSVDCVFVPPNLYKRDRPLAQ